MPKPLCKFCRAHHDADAGHPAEAVREALAELRRTEPRESEWAVSGRGGVSKVMEAKPPVTEPVTKSVVTKPAVTKGRPRMEHPSAEALRRRAYRERREA